MMKSLMCLLALAAAPTQALGRPAWPTGGVNVASSDRVLVLGAPRALVHTNSAPAQRSKLTFSPAGLAELALDALGLPTGHVAGARAANPLQADVFTHAQAYALVLVDSAVSTPVLQSIDTTGADSSFRHTYPLAAGWSDMIPSVIAREFKTGFGDDATVACAGSSAICKHSLQQQASDDEAELQQVLEENSYLDMNNEADKAFAHELAQAKGLTKTVADSQKAAHALFVLGFSSVQALEAGATREAANTALAAQISAFLAAFQIAYTNSGVQIVAAASSAAGRPQQWLQSPHAKVLDDVMSYDRMLLSFDDLSGSGSDASDDSNATATNSTAGQLSMEEIAEYQIVLWTSVVLVAVLVLTVLAMVNMDVGRDSLLYAKFITDASHRKGE